MTSRTFVRARSDARGAGPRTRRGFQIGPKIRIGGTIGKIGQNVKNAVTKGVTDTGHFIGDAATNPWVDGSLAAILAATGVGVPAAAAIMAGTKGIGELIKPGGNLGNAATGGLKGAALGAGAGLAGKALGALSGGAIGSAAGDVAGAAGGGGALDSIKGLLGSIPGGIEAVGKYLGGSLGGDIGGLLGDAKDFLTGNGGANALGLAQAANAAMLQKQSSDYGQQALAGKQQSWDDRSGLRSAGIQGMLNPITPDLSSLLKNSGPYVQGLPAVAPAARYTGGGYTGAGAGLTAPAKVS